MLKKGLINHPTDKWTAVGGVDNVSYNNEPEMLDFPNRVHFVFGAKCVEADTQTEIETSQKELQRDTELQRFKETNTNRETDTQKILIKMLNLSRSEGKKI